ncbi:hypothetical protein B0T25DRAFT_628398 [Lasiosphaeria hispida]|uniref:Uncharacterized protein n=1 Tax=Lasiosphaeria hispida TaxID=260671 RepID=A0AAJ0HP21_9PEZI|nr:hypothetical protein B0T25DRAFT_628398 [Lasiosphaeria hispida]
MCIRSVPHHPWCDCRDPDPIYRDEADHCPHHVYFQRETPAEGAEGAGFWENIFIGDTETDLEICDKLQRPRARWIHCQLYEATWADSAGRLTEGRELGCVHTLLLNAAGSAAHKAYYEWDSLCGYCCQDGDGIGLPAVRLHKAPPSERSTPSVPRFLLPNGEELDEGIAEAIQNRPVQCHFQRAFIYLAEKQTVYEEFEIDMEKSAIYLLPPSEENSESSPPPVQNNSLRVLTQAAVGVASWMRGLTRRRTS